MYCRWVNAFHITCRCRSPLSSSSLLHRSLRTMISSRWFWMWSWDTCRSASKSFCRAWIKWLCSSMCCEGVNTRSVSRRMKNQPDWYYRILRPAEAGVLLLGHHNELQLGCLRLEREVGFYMMQSISSVGNVRRQIISDLFTSDLSSGYRRSISK